MGGDGEQRTVADAEKLAPYVQLRIAEFQALRAEMKWLIDHGANYERFSVVLIAATFPMIAFVEDTVPMILPIFLVAMPIPFCVLALLFLRNHREVRVVAGYLNGPWKRSVLQQFSDVEDVELWEWDRYKNRGPEDGPRGRRAFKGFGLRGTLFFLPSTGYLAAGAIIAVQRYAFLSMAALLTSLLCLVGLLLVSSVAFRIKRMARPSEGVLTQEQEAGP